MASYLILVAEAELKSWGLVFALIHVHGMYMGGALSQHSPKPVTCPVARLACD